MPRAHIATIIEKAYQVELDGHTFYSLVADRTDKDAVRELFAKLAKDEAQHQAYLRQVAAAYDERRAAAFAFPRGEAPGFSDQVLTERFKQQAREAAFEVSALSIAMTLETNAVALYHREAAEAADAEVRDFFRFLEGWERGHFEVLQDLYENVRRDLFTERGFDPF